MRLRPRQHEAVERSVAALKTFKNTLLVAPTGAGKTIMLSAVVGRRIHCAEEGKPNKALILQHRDELVDQNTRKFKAINPNIPVSIFDAGTKSWRGRAVFGMVQTITRPANLASMPALDSLTVDEAHHSTADSYRKVIDRAREINPDVAIFGATATPNRGDGTPMRKIFDNVADQITIGELIASGHLVRPRTYVLDVGATQALAGVRKLASDFDMNAVAEIMDREIITDQIIARWRELAGDRKTVAFASTVAHAEHVAEAFRNAGVTSEVVHGALGKTERADVLARYGKNRIQVLVNVAVLTEGWDHPPTSCVILLRPSSYKSTMVQMIGRGLRTVDPAEFPGVVKTDCIVLDFGTSSLTHGSLEDDANLDGKPKTGEAPTMQCPGCGATVPISTLECPLCGYQWERSPREKTILGEVVLTEIDLLAKSNFKWVDIWGDERALIAAGFNAWAGLFWWEGLWHAVGGNKNEMKHLGVGERIMALALGDDYLNANEDDKSAHKSKRWLREPATEKQLAALGMPTYDTSVSKYNAMCRLSFKFNKSGINALVKGYTHQKEAA
jgi:DNA repair protein RadD